MKALETHSAPETHPPRLSVQWGEGTSDVRSCLGAWCTQGQGSSWQCLGIQLCHRHCCVWKRVLEATGQVGRAVALMEAECVLCASLWAEEDTEVTTCRDEGGV